MRPQIARVGTTRTKNAQGHTLIDVSELIRVYGEQFRVDDTGDVTSDGTELRSATPNSDSGDSALAVEVAVLKERISGKEEIIDRLEKRIAELKGRDEDQQKQIADMRVEAAEKAAERRGWFSGWFVAGHPKASPERS